LPTLQISAQGASRFTENAWEIDGASAANSIAKQAIQTAIWRVIIFIPMLKLYQRLSPIVINKRLPVILHGAFAAFFYRRQAVHGLNIHPMCTVQKARKLIGKTVLRDSICRAFSGSSFMQVMREKVAIKTSYWL